MRPLWEAIFWVGVVLTILGLGPFEIASIELSSSFLGILAGTLTAIGLGLVVAAAIGKSQSRKPTASS